MKVFSGDITEDVRCGVPGQVPDVDGGNDVLAVSVDRCLGFLSQPGLLETHTRTSVMFSGDGGVLVPHSSRADRNVALRSGRSGHSEDV